MDTITLTETGCFLDNHRGHYIQRDAIELAVEYGYIIGGFEKFAGSAARAGAGKNSHFGAGVQERGGFFEVSRFRNDFRTRISDAGPRKTMSYLGLFVVTVLNVLGQDNGRHAIAGDGDPHGAVNQVTNLRRRRCFLDEAGDVGKHPV